MPINNLNSSFGFLSLELNLGRMVVRLNLVGGHCSQILGNFQAEAVIACFKPLFLSNLRHGRQASQWSNTRSSKGGFYSP